ncbi:hypothetical protein ACWDSF_30365 [Nocardia beijingensis]
MNQPHDTTDDEGSPETPAASDKDTSEGRSENSGSWRAQAPEAAETKTPIRKSKA